MWHMSVNSVLTSVATRLEGTVEDPLYSSMQDTASLLRAISHDLERGVIRRDAATVMAATRLAKTLERELDEDG